MSNPKFLKIPEFEFGMQIPLNPPEINFDLNTITQKIMVESIETVDDAILANIIDIAKAKGISTLIVLDREHIYHALDSQVAKKVAPISGYNTLKACPVCGTELLYSSKYCHDCGQRVKWED